MDDSEELEGYEDLEEPAALIEDEEEEEDEVLIEEVLIEEEVLKETEEEEWEFARPRKNSLRRKRMSLDSEGREPSLRGRKVEDREEGRGDCLNPLEPSAPPVAHFGSPRLKTEMDRADEARRRSIPFRDSQEMLRHPSPERKRYEFDRSVLLRKKRPPRRDAWNLTADLLASASVAASLAMTAAAAAALILPEAPGVAFDSFIGGTAVTGILLAAASRVPWATAGLDVALVPLLNRAAQKCRQIDSDDEDDGSEGLAASYLCVQALLFFCVGVCSLSLGRFRRTKITSYLPYTVTAGLMGSIGAALAANGIEYGFRVGGWSIALSALALAVAANAAKRRSSFPKFALAPLALLAGFVIDFLLLKEAAAPSVSLGARGWRLDEEEEGAAAKASSGNGELIFARVRLSAMWQSRGVILAACVVGTLNCGVKCGSLVGLNRDADVDQEAMLAGAATVAAAACGCAGQTHSVAALKIQRQLNSSKSFAPMLVSIWALVTWFGGASRKFYLVPRTALAASLVDLGLDYVDTFVFYPLLVGRTTDKWDSAVLVSIVVSGLVSSTVEAVSLGLGLALVGACRKLARKSVVAQCVTGREARSTLYRTAAALRTLEERGDSVVILELVGYLFFGSAKDLVDAVHSRPDHMTCLVLDVTRLLPTLDASAVAAVDAVANLSKIRDFAVWIAPSGSEAGLELAKRLEDHGAVVFVESVDDALERAEDLILLEDEVDDSEDGLLLDPDQDLVLGENIPSFFKTSIKNAGAKSKLASDFLEGADVPDVSPSFAKHLADAANILELAEGEESTVSGSDLFLVGYGRLRLISAKGGQCVRKLTPGSVVGVTDFYIRRDGTEKASDDNKPRLRAVSESAILVVPHAFIDQLAASPTEYHLAFYFHTIMGRSLAQKNVTSKLAHRVPVSLRTSDYSPRPFTGTDVK